MLNRSRRRRLDCRSSGCPLAGRGIGRYRSSTTRSTLFRRFKTPQQPVHLPDAKATVIVFLSFDCPVSTSYAAPLSDLAKAYAAQGVTFVGLCPCDASAAEVEKQAKDFASASRSYKTKLSPRPTPSRRRRHRRCSSSIGIRSYAYRGRIDNGYYAGSRRTRKSRRRTLKRAR